jgi:hypothetical protein
MIMMKLPRYLSISSSTSRSQLSRAKQKLIGGIKMKMKKLTGMKTIEDIIRAKQGFLRRGRTFKRVTSRDSTLVAGSKIQEGSNAQEKHCSISSESSSSNIAGYTLITMGVG